MNGRVTRPENPLTRRVFTSGLFLVQFAVLDDLHVVADVDKNPHAFHGTQLLYNARRQLRIVQRVQTDQGRIAHDHRWIVDLMVKEVLDAFRRHSIQQP